MLDATDGERKSPASTRNGVRPAAARLRFKVAMRASPPAPSTGIVEYTSLIWRIVSGAAARGELDASCCPCACTVRSKPDTACEQTSLRSCPCLDGSPIGPTREIVSAATPRNTRFISTAQLNPFNSTAQLHPRSDLREIDVAAAQDDADAATGHGEVPFEQRGCSQGTRRLDDELQPFPQVEHRPQERRIIHRCHVGHVVQHERKCQPAERPSPRAISHGKGILANLQRLGSKRWPRIIASGGFDADDAAGRGECLGRESRTREQATTAARHKQYID